MKKKEILKTVSIVFYLAAVILFILSIVGVISDNGVVQPVYLILGALALGAANILKNTANKK